MERPARAVRVARTTRAFRVAFVAVLAGALLGTAPGAAPTRTDAAPTRTDAARTDAARTGASRAGAAAPGPSAGASLGAGPPRVHFRGWAFDTCETPPLATMRAWRASKYRAVGVYYAGRGRGCPVQRHLDRRWVKAVHRMGWRIIPVYVGSQSPCVYARHKRGARVGPRPWSQGEREARHAVREARALGLGRGSALYLDIEAYEHRNARCATETLRYVRGWNRELRALGFEPGYYSSAESGVRHMERARKARIADLPTVMWFARWHIGPSVHREPALHPTAWQPRRRIHQYAGNVAERHGGRRLVIDRNRVDAIVARVGR
ncbi:glycoside hydrolase domain-containing protein [Streptomyces sp. NPDC050504]|uniref:glycoside hydrolase domain-containing protein n=1 Tax=Streptomyces sp. NPDC050504 TaxID=3365618 RepID=UPI00379E4479